MDNKKSFLNKIALIASSIFFFLISIAIYGQSEFQIQKIQKHYSASKLTTVSSNLINDYTNKQSKIFSLAKKNGWEISEKNADGSYSELHDIGPDGTPIYYTTFNDKASKVSRADTMYDDGLLNLGINGEGMKVGVWDAGAALTTHQEFDSRVTIADDAKEIAAHATMVLGTMVAAGVKEKAKGVAYKASAITNDWRRDKIEVTHAAAEGLLLSNHSYGIKSDRVPDWYFGSYIKVSQDWDKIMYNLPYYLMVTAAGNTQQLKDNETPIYGKSDDGFDLMLGFTASKNGITVAAADSKVDNKGNILEATIATYSSFGPVDDGRIKPDIAGSGSNIFSTHASGDQSYNTFSGTSMAAPSVTASMLLLQQYYEQLNNEYMKAATLKGITLHTADDVNEKGPDYKMGWGVINTKKAAELITNNTYTTHILEENIKTGESYSITVDSDGSAPLIASISWTDPAAEYVNKGILNDPTPALVNDLDIRITKDGQTYYPWKLSAANASAPAKKGDNMVDPFEKIEIDAIPGSYTITITHKNTLKNKSQNFSLIISGIKTTNCRLDAPKEVISSVLTEDSITLEWNAIPAAFYEIHYKEVNATKWTSKYTTENTITLPSLIHAANYEVKVRTFCTENAVSPFSAITTFQFLGKETLLYKNLDSATKVAKLNYTIFPNPAVEEIHIEGNVLETYDYTIVNTSGLVIKQGNSTEKHINIASLASGLYILTVYDNKGAKSTKFYKD